MTEPSQERRLTFGSPRDEALYVMCLGSWACESCGSADDALGSSWWMSNSQPEMAEIVDAFADEFEEVGLRDRDQLIGNWLIMQSGAYVDVMKFPSEDEVRAAYDRVERLHNQMEASA